MSEENRTQRDATIWKHKKTELNKLNIKHHIVLWCVLHCMPTGTTVAVRIGDVPVSKLDEHRLNEKHSVTARQKI
jgi:hypothetical protein